MIVSDGLIHTFFAKVTQGSIEIYNEFSLQHEFGVFLRNTTPPEFKVQFERPVSYFGIEDELKKTEIDIATFRSPQAEREVVELKFPRRGRTPDTMFDTCIDIQFIEQLKKHGFIGGYAILVADDSDYYQPKREKGGIYPYFRSGRTLNGRIMPRTGRKVDSVDIKGSYVLVWHPIRNEMKYTFARVA